MEGVSHQTVAHGVQAGQPRLTHTFAADRESPFMKAGYGKTVCPVCAADGGKLFIGRLLRPDSGASREGPNDGEGETPTHLEGVMPRKPEDPGARSTNAVKPQGPAVRVEAPLAGSGNERPGNSGLMEKVCERQNLQAALKRVRQNAGSPGLDGMTVDELPNHLRVHWPRPREDLLAGRYQPQPVKRIPKPGGGERELGIPTVLDRFIQQAL